MLRISTTEAMLRMHASAARGLAFLAIRTRTKGIVAHCVSQTFVKVCFLRKRQVAFDVKKASI